MTVMQLMRMLVTRVGLACFVVVGLVAVGNRADAGPLLIYEGAIGTSNSGDAPENVVEQGAGWVESPGASLSWQISYDAGTSLWNYLYTFTRPTQGNLSHILIELSQGALVQDAFMRVTIDGGLVDTEVTPVIETFEPSDPDKGDQPGMPGNLYGVKFDTPEVSTDTNPIVFGFNTDRAPVWGDFYAKDGRSGGGGPGSPLNAAWNSGFLAEDPTDPARNGQLAGHILRPDTKTGPPTVATPEPSTLISAGIAGLVGLNSARRRRKQAIA